MINGKNGRIGEPVGSKNINKSATNSGRIGEPVGNRKITVEPLVLPGMPVSMQMHLTDAQKQEAAISRGFNSVADEAAYAKNNSNLYAVTGGKKYMESGYAALKNPQTVITPENLTDEGKKAVKSAQDADAGKTKYDDYTPEQIDKVISAKWHRSTNDAETKKTVDFLKALKGIKEIGFKNFQDYNQTRQNSEAMSKLKSDMDKAYKSYQKAKVGVVSKAVDRYIGGSKNTESLEETQKREAWEKAAAKYYSVLYGGKQALEQRHELLKQATAPMSFAWQKSAALKALGIKPETAIREEREVAAALKRTVRFDNYASYIGENVKAGAVNLATGLSATGEFIFGTPIKFAIEMSGGDPNIISGKSARDALTNEFNKRANEAAQAVGDDRNIGGQLIQNVIQNIPNMVLAFATAGGSEAVNLVDKAASLRGKAGALEKIGVALKSLAQNPLYWMSFATTAGNDYEEALANGANPNIAMLYALAASGLNAYIEIGGGVETLPKDLIGLKSGGEMLKEFITTSLEEGGEEILQGTVSKLFSRLMYDRSPVTLEGMTDWARESLYEGAMGVLGGAVMGGGQMTFSYIKNAKTVKEYKAIGQLAINAGQADNIIKYALGSDIYSDLAQTANETHDSKTIGELYSYITRDVETAINKVGNIESAVEGLQSIARQEGINNDTYAITRGIAVPQFIEKVQEFEFDEKTASAVADAVLFADNAKNATAQEEAQESATDSEADNGFDEVTESDNAGDDSGAEAYDGDEVGGTESEENIFTEPDKREINENMINGRGLNIVQEHIEETAKKLDPDIKIKWDPYLDKHGSFNPYSKVLTLRADLTAAEAYVEIFKHEFMHDLELRGGYDKFLKFLENKSVAFVQYAKNVLKENDIEYKGGNAGAVKALFDLYYEIYTTDERIMPVARKAFTLEDAKREAAADFFADVLFKGKEYRSEIATALKYDNELPEGSYETSLSALEEIAHKDKNLFHHIIEAVKRFISNIKGNKTTRKLEADLARLERKLQDVYESAETKKPTEDGGVKWSIKNIFDSEGNDYGIGVFLDSELLSNLSEKERIKKVKEYVIAISGKVFTAFDKNGKPIQIRIAKSNEKFKNKSGKIVPVNKDLTTKYNKNTVKQESVVLLDELIATARQESSEPSKYPHGWLDDNGNNYWDKWTTFIQDKNKSIWQATLHIANTKSGEKILYDISTIIKVGRSGKSDANPTTNSISENPQKSQEKVSETDSEYLNLAKNPEKNEAKLREMVDEAAKESGYTFEGWHGTKSGGFTSFEKAKIRSGATLYGNMGDGFYFTDNKAVANKYGDGNNTYHVYLKLNKPFIFTSIKDMDKIGILNEYAEKIGKEKLSGLESFVDANKRTGSLISRVVGDGKGFSEYLISQGYDSIVYTSFNYENNTSDKNYVVFEPEQIKSADLVTYDDNGNIIPLSERFNSYNPDIRFSLRGDRLEELRYNPTMFAKRLINKFAIKNVEVEELAGKLRELVAKHNKGGKEWDYNSDGEIVKVPVLDSLIDELSKDLAGYIKPQIYPEAQEALKLIRNTTVYIDDIQRKEILYHYGTLTNFRKSSKLKISPNASISLDSMWQEWAAAYPEYFSADTNSVDMPEEFNRIVNSLENAVEEFDEDGAAEYIAKEIKDILDNTGTRARNREIAQAANEAAKKATEKERARGDKKFEEYRRKESERKYNEAVSKRKREYREKALKLRDKFTKKLGNPKKGSYVPQPFIRAVVDALDIIYDNPIDYDDSKIGGKYYARLEKLNQEIQNASNDTVREALKDKYDRLFRIATNAADKVTEIKKMFDALKSEDAYEATYKDAGDDKLFYERTQMYDENISQMLEVLSRELGDTEAYNYNEHQLRIISEVFAALEKHISDYNKLIRAEERIEVAEVANGFIDEIKRSHGNFKLLSKAMFAQMSPMRLFRMLGNYETGSQAETIADELDKGQKISIEYTMKAEEMLKREILGDKDLFRETKKMFSTKESDLVDSGLVDEKGNKVMITRGMRLSLIMHGRNEQNRNAVMGGVEIPKDLKSYYKNGAAKSKSDTFKAVVPTDALQWFTKLDSSLSDIEKKWIEVFDKYYSEVSAPALNEITMQVYGFKKATVKNYWRIVRTEHFLDKPVDTVVHDALLEHAGYLEKRKNAKNPIFLMDAIDQLQNDIDNHANYYGLVIPLSNFSKVYNYAQYDFDTSSWGTSVKEAIDDKYSGGAVTDYIKKLIADLNGARKREVSIFDRLRGKYAGAVLMLNPRVAVKQTASYPTAAAVIGWKPLLKALAVVEDKNGDKKFIFARAELDEIAKYSPLLWYRMRGNMDVELGSLKEAGSPGDKLAKKMPALLGWINKMDAATVGRLWYASKYYVEDNFKLEKNSPQFYKKTAEIFEKVIEETQPNYSVMQRPEILRSTNALTRAVTMFYTQRLQNANILFDAFMELGTKKDAYKNANATGKDTARAELKEAISKVAHAISSQAVSIVLLNVMELAIRAALSQMKPYRDKDTDEVTASEIFKGLGDGCLETLFGTVVFGSEIYDAVKLGVGAATGQYYGIQVPAVETINDIINSFINDGEWVGNTVKKIKENNITAGEFAEELTAHTLDTFIKAIQPFAGVPIKNVKDLISGIVHSAMDAINGEVFSFEAAVDNNAYNRIVGAKSRTNTQYYHILAEAVINDDKEKYESTLKRLLDSTKPDKDTLSDIKKALKASETVKSEADKALSDVKSKKVYKSLSDDGKEEVEKDIRDAIANEKLLSVKRSSSKKFKQLYEYSKYRDKTDFEKLKKEMLKDGFSDNEIDIGLEVEKFKLLKEQGITVAEWFTAKRALSEENAKKNAEKYKAIQKMDFSAKDKDALWENMK